MILAERKELADCVNSHTPCSRIFLDPEHLFYIPDIYTRLYIYLKTGLLNPGTRDGRSQDEPKLDFSSKSDFGSETNENLRKTKKNRPGGLPN